MSLLPDPLRPLYQPSPNTYNWVEAMSLVMEDYNFSNTWSLERGSARRIVFLYDDHYAITWCGWGESDFPGVLQVWYTSDDWLDEKTREPLLPCPVIVGEEIPWDEETRTWRWETEDLEVVVEFLNAGFNASVAKKVELFLPWQGFESEEDVTEIASVLPRHEATSLLEVVDNLAEEEVQNVTNYLAELNDGDTYLAPYVFAALERGYPFSYPEEWGTVTTFSGYGDEWLPPCSPLSAFYMFIAEVETLPNTFVIWDECCAACASGSREMIRSSRGLGEDAVDIVLWGQNSQYQYMPDGSLSALLYADSPEIEALMKKYNIAGLDLG